MRTFSQRTSIYYNIMKFEHIAFDVADPVALAAWYCEHLSLKIVLHLPQPSEIHFLTDDTGSFCVEVYRNAAVESPNYHARDPILFHVAFQSDDPATDKERLVAAGATFHTEAKRPDAHVVMLRDPWGIGLQLVKRTTPLVTIDRAVT